MGSAVGHSQGTSMGCTSSTWCHKDDDYPYPHPDFLQVVFAGRAAERSGGREAMWSDMEGYELSSKLMSLEAAYQKVVEDPLSRVFLDLLRYRYRHPAVYR